jgi:hypothetical protein
VAGATPCPKNGVAGPPHFWPRGSRPPYTGRMGVAEATPGLWGWSGHPERPKTGRWCPKPPPGGPPPKSQTHFFSFFFFWPFGVAGPPPKARGGFGHPHTAGMGWPATPKGQKRGGPATPFFGQGVAPATPISPFFLKKFPSFFH